MKTAIIPVRLVGAQGFARPRALSFLSVRARQLVEPMVAEGGGAPK
jgi:hypothetical protein